MAAHAARAMLRAALPSVPLANQLARRGEVHRRKRSMPGSSPKSLVRRCLMLLSVWPWWENLLDDIFHRETQSRDQDDLLYC